MLADAVQYARNRGALIVAAMGNDGRAEATYPRRVRRRAGRGATDRNDQRLSSSNTGPLRGPRRAGPADPEHLLGAAVGNTYAQASTTSQAPPHVAGVAGLLWSVNPDLRGDAVRALLVNHADDVGPPGRDDETGAGASERAALGPRRAALELRQWRGIGLPRAAEAAPRVYLPYVMKAG